MNEAFRIAELTGVMPMSREALEQAYEDFVAIMGMTPEQLFEKWADEAKAFRLEDCTKPLTPNLSLGTASEPVAGQGDTSNSSSPANKP